MKKAIFLIGFLPALFLTACQKELSDNFTTYTNNPLNDTIWARNVSGGASVHELQSLLAPEFLVDSFEVARDTTLKYGDSLEISFTAGSCISASGVVTGKVKLELLRLRSKGDYIRTFRPTTAGVNLLEAGGAFFIRVSKDNKELSLAPNTTVKIRFSDTDDPKSNMQVFYGRESNPLPVNSIDTAFTWQRDSDSTLVPNFQKSSSGPGPGIKGYDLLTKNLRWIAVERYVDSNRAKAKLSAIFSPNFTNKNTAVFAVFTDQKTVVSLRPDFASRSFAAANIPLGNRFKIVSLSRIGDDLYLGTKDVNDIGSVAAYSMKPEKKSLKEILSFLNSL